MKICVLGAGLAGLSFLYHLKKPLQKEAILIEKSSGLGGLCKTDKTDGYLFDYAGHLLHINSKYTLNLLKNNLGIDFLKHKRDARVHIADKYIKYPWQVNLYGLPVNILIECLFGFIEANISEKSNKSKNFLEYSIHTFGKGITKYFMKPYNEKLWRVPLKNLGTQWVKAYVPVPTIEETINGAFFPPRKEFGYNIEFFYPKKSGIQAIANGFAKKINSTFSLNNPMVSIDMNKKKIYTEDENFDYDFLISSIPLPILIKNIKNIPTKISNYASQLQYVNTLVINLGLDSLNDSLKRVNWIYFPEKKFIFHRIGFPYVLSEDMAPKGKFSISIEINYNDLTSQQISKYVEDSIKQIVSTGLISNKSEVDLIHNQKMSPSYVIFDQNHDNAVKKIIDYLNKKNIFTIGRYGKWTYDFMESAILGGKELANKYF
jgi:protoporphyrinogen oxidase